MKKYETLFLSGVISEEVYYQIQELDQNGTLTEGSLRGLLGENFDTYSKPKLGGFGESYVIMDTMGRGKPNYFFARLSVSGETGLTGAQDFEKRIIQTHNQSYGMDKNTVNSLTNFVNHLGRDFIETAKREFSNNKMFVTPDDNAFYIDISKLKEQVTAISRENKAGPLQDTTTMFEKYLQQVAEKLNMTIENNGTLLVKKPAV